MAALAPLLGALLTVAACYAFGSLLLARMGIALARVEKAPLAFTLGAAVLHLAIFTILALHVAYAPVLLTLPAIVIVGALWTGDWRLPLEPKGASNYFWPARAMRLLFVGAAATFTVLYFFNAWAPEISPDGSGYHLPLMAGYLQAHGFRPLHTIVYASLSAGVEMLFLPAYSIGGGSAAALVHFAFLVALALAVRAYGHRTGHGLAGDAAALLVYLSPVAGIDGTTAYVDIATAAIVFSAFYWTQMWDEDRRNSLLVCAGLLGGFCYAAKYTAAVMAIYAAGFVLWRTRSPRAAMLVAACAAIMAGPWLLKNWIYVGNPIAPFGNAVFPNPYIHREFERVWLELLRTYGMPGHRELFWDVIVTGRFTQSPLGPVFVLLPLALLALRKTTGRRLLIPGFLLAATYFTNIATRFLLPSLPFFSLALALAFEEIPIALLAIVLVHAAASWPRTLRHYVVTEAWVLRSMPVRAALRRQSEEDYLNHAPNYRAARMIERVVPPGEKVLAMSGVARSYTSRDVLINYEGALNQDLSDALDSGWDELVRPSRALVFRFPARMLRRIRVMQTAKIGKVDEQWSVQEIRVLLRGTEVRRSGDWRLRASPNPWAVSYAFDNSEATRWRSWEKAAPGMFIDADFGRSIQVDQVRVETSADNPEVQLRLEELDEQGKWSQVGGAPEQLTWSPQGSLRRAAAYELRTRGVGYLFVRDRDPGAEFYSADPGSWDFTPVARGEQATIYKIGR